MAKNEMKSKAIMEIAPGTHSQFGPNLVDFSACVPPPALQQGLQVYLFIYYPYFHIVQ